MAAGATRRLPAGWFFAPDIKEYRWIYQDLVPEGGRTAEVGVYRGRSLASVADIIRAKRLIVTAVDNFEPFDADEATDRFAHFATAMEEYALLPHLQIHPDNSVEASHEIPDRCLDFVFIDADHSFSAVAADIAAWRPKLVCGGYLGGHDYLEVGVHEAIAQAQFDNLLFRNPQSSIWLTRIGKNLCD